VNRVIPAVFSSVTGDFEVFFTLQWRHAAPMGVTFGVEESTEGDVGVWGTKRKVLPNFHQISKYERLASAHPLRDF